MQSPLRQIIKDYIGGGWGKDAPDKDHVVPAHVIRGTDLDAVQSCDTGGVPYRWHKPSNARTRTLMPGDIVFEVSGGSKDQPVGRSLLLDTVRLARFQAAAIPASFCKKIRPDQDKVHPRFLLAHLQLAWSDRRIVQWQVQSTGISNFNFEAFLDDFLIDLPPLPVQQRIAGILSAYDELIENSQRRIKILESMARALYREWFVHFRFPGHEHHPRVASPLGEIPQGWEVKRLDEVCRSIQDGDWIETKDQGGEDYRLLQISNVGVGEFIETGNFRYVTQATFDRLRCNEIVPGDLLVARMPTPIGRGWLVTRMPWRMITAVDVAIIRAEPTVIHPLFLVQAWNDSSNLQRISAQASGTTRLRITRRELAAMEFVIPPIPVQQQFAKIAQPQSTMVEALRQQIQNLRRTRDLLLPRLLSGQIDVSNPPEPVAA